MHYLNAHLRRIYYHSITKIISGNHLCHTILKADGRYLGAKHFLRKNDCPMSFIQRNFCNGYDTREFGYFKLLKNRKLLQSIEGLHINKRSFHLSSNFSANENRGSSNESNQNEDDDDGQKNLVKNLIKSSAFYILTALTIVSIMRNFQSEEKNEVTRYVSWNEFLHQMLVKGEVEEVLIRPNINIVTIFLREGAVVGGVKVTHRMFLMNITDMGKFEYNLREAESSLGIRPEDGVKVVYDRRFDENTQTILSTALAIVLVGLFMRQMSKGASKISSQFFSMGRAKYTFIDPLLPGSGKGVKLSDVAGATEAKQEVMEFVNFLKNPEKYQRLGARVPKGALLLGPPGCGKTLLAKAVATEGSVPFLSMNGSEFVEVIGGLGAARVRDLFKQAKKYSPCIIYIDEIDAIGRQRGSGTATANDGGSGESEQTLNQLLVEMDGILSKEGVLLLASTNRLDILDRALLRPGRFDRQIMMGLPTQDERAAIFKHHLKGISLEFKPETYATRMASLTLGFTGADIANVVNEAALYAARIAKKVVTSAELEYAVERVVGGSEKKSTVLSPEERKIVAYHEAGHALMGWLLEHTDALLKVTIVPRTSQALGFAQYAPKDKHLHAQDELFEKMCMALGGRVAESIIFNRITTGAQNDLEKVTDMAYAQVRSFGFSPIVGHVSFPGKEGQGGGTRPYSNKLANIIDTQANALIFSAYKKTEEILLKNVDKLTLLAEDLMKKETLNYDDVEALLGPPSFEGKHVIEPLQFEGEIKEWKDAGKDV